MVWDILGNFGSALSGVSAFVALIFAAIQVIESKRAAREANALQSHREYLSLCLQRPELSSSLMFAKTARLRSFHDIRETLTPLSESYLWLLSILLNNCEQVLDSVNDDKEWRKVLSDQLRSHYPALDILWPDWRQGYGNKLNDLWEKVKALGPEEDWNEYVRSGEGSDSASDKHNNRAAQLQPNA